MSEGGAVEIPWKRLTAEGTVIVLSILLAFGIDASWGRVQESRRATTYAAGLLEDALENQRRLTTTARVAESSLGAAIELSDLLGSSAAEQHPDSVLGLLVAAFGVVSYEPVTQSYDQLVSSGELGLMPLAVRDALAESTQVMARLENTFAQQQEDRHLSVVPFLVDETSLRRAFLARVPDARLGTSRFGPDIEALATNRRLDNLLTYRIVYGMAQVSNYGSMADALEDLVTALNETVE